MTNLISKLRRLFQPNTKAENSEVPENWHEDFITQLASVLRPNLYIELGLYECALFNKVSPYCGHAIGVDASSRPSSYMRKSDKTTFHCMRTDDFAKKFSEHPRPIDLLFIDADHSRKSAESDFWNLFPFVKDHGIIVLHDTHPKNLAYTDPKLCGDAYLAIPSISQNQDLLELVTIPVHPGLSICRKRKRQLSWE